MFLSTIYRIRGLNKSYARRTGEGRVYYAGSYSVLVLLYVVVAVGSVVEFFVIRSQGQINLLLSGVGLALYVGVMPLRRAALDALGENMSPEVEIKKNHRLVKEGPYRYLRHPLALCVLLELLGFTLVSNAYYALLGMLFLFLPYVLLRIRWEEKALLERFGQEYRRYQQEVCALLPLSRNK